MYLQKEIQEAKSLSNKFLSMAVYCDTMIEEIPLEAKQSLVDHWEHEKETCWKLFHDMESLCSKMETVSLFLTNNKHKMTVKVKSSVSELTQIIRDAIRNSNQENPIIELSFKLSDVEIETNIINNQDTDIYNLDVPGKD